VPKFVFGVNAVNGHARAHHVEECLGMLEKTEAGSSVLSSKSDAFFFERSASFVEAAKLLFVEIGIFGKSHHRSMNADRLAAGKIANERRGVSIGHADAADAGVDADVEGDGLLRFGGTLVQRGAQKGIDHGRDAAGDGVFEIAIVERAEKENRLANAGVAQSDSFVQLHDGETEDFPLRLEDLGDIGHAHAVAVIFDDGKDGTRSHTAGDFLDVMAQVFAVNLHPRIEGGIFRSGF